jgi:hypothetical protein
MEFHLPVKDENKQAQVRPEVDDSKDVRMRKSIVNLLN